MSDLYSLLREFADSWVLLALFLVFAFVVIWAFRPGSRAIHQDVAGIPFRHESRPAPSVNKGAEAQEALK